MPKGKPPKMALAGLTGIQDTGQSKTMIAPQENAGRYVDQTAKYNDQLARHMASCDAEHQADYEKFGAVYQGVNPLPERAVKPAHQAMNEAPGMPKLPNLKKGSPGMRSGDQHKK